MIIVVGRFYASKLSCLPATEAVVAVRPGKSMGGCCAPGTLGATTTSAMEEDGSSSGETKGGGGGGCGFLELTERPMGAADQVPRVLEDTTAEKRGVVVGVEELLQVLKIAVEKEYVSLRDYCNVGGLGNEGLNHYEGNTASLGSSLAESPTSVYSAAGSIFSRSSSTKEKSPQQSSPGAGESCNSEKQKVSSTEHYRASNGRTRTSLDWAERVEATLESMHHMQRENPSSEVNSRHSRPSLLDKTLGNFDKILPRIVMLDPQSQSIQPSTSPRSTEVVTEFDDYPRGSSDTNSEEAERDRKMVSSIPVNDTTCLSHQVRATSFMSLGSVQSQLREKQAIPTNHVMDGSMRTDESYSTRDQVKDDSLRAAEASTSIFRTNHAQEVYTGANDSYANWLERHSKELGWKNSFKYRRKENLSEYETNSRNDRPFADCKLKDGVSDLRALQRHTAGLESSCPRSWTSQRDLAEFEPHTTENGRASEGHLNGGQTGTIRNIKSVAEFGSNFTSSWRTQGMCDQISDFGSFRSGEYCEGSFKVTPDLNLVDSSHALSGRMGIPSGACVVRENSSKHQQGWERADLSEWARTGLGRSYETFHIVAKAATPSTSSSNGGLKTLPSPSVVLETPSSVGSRFSKLNSIVGTPKSVLSGGGSLAINSNLREKVKVCVRMRPFDDHEKVCPLRQLLCVMGKKVIVKEYDKPTFRRSVDTNETDAPEFRVDHVVDDSYLQKHRTEKKEESQRRMYESIGLPCLKNALDGYNTTILAYGQVGTGKTHTMMGDGTEEGSGLMPRLAKELMHQLSTEFKGEFELQVSYLEIYQERIRDLLAVKNLEFQALRCGSVRRCSASWFECSDESIYEGSVDYDTPHSASFCVGTPKSLRPERIPSAYFYGPVQKKRFLKVREHPVVGPYVEGLLWKDVATWQDLETVMLQGAANRTLAATPLNKFSSRGHTLFTIKLIRQGRRFVNGSPTSCFSLINLVDLAGTEKPQCARKTSLERQDESRCINRSLAQLNDVILNLSRNKKFVSYRGSALTWLLRDSLGGNSKLFLIANISPAEQDFQESVNTLRYASKVNGIPNIITSLPGHKKQSLVRVKKENKVLHTLIHDFTKNNFAECISSE